MIGDNIKLTKKHLEPAQQIFELINKKIAGTNKYVITLAGESGCGKSTLSLAIQKILERNKIGSCIFHMDDYFRLPPTTNHEARLKDIAHVGPKEVRLDLLQKHINAFKEGEMILSKPLVHYQANSIFDETVVLMKYKVIIVEGTYTALLESIGTKIFMLRNYIDTLEDRKKRARDPIIPFNEKVLKIENAIIEPHAKLADILVDKNYKVIF